MSTIRYEISNYEQGRTAVPLDKLYEMVEVLSINITDLLIEEEEIVDNSESICRWCRKCGINRAKRGCCGAR